MEERCKKAFDFASEATKQLIGLSTGIIALTITFSKEMLGGSVSIGEKRVLMAAWAVYLISITFGIITLLNLAGSLEPKDKVHPALEPTIWAPNVRRFSMMQIAAFLLATALVIGFAIISV